NNCKSERCRSNPASFVCALRARQPQASTVARPDTCRIFPTRGPASVSAGAQLRALAETGRNRKFWEVLHPLFGFQRGGRASADRNRVRARSSPFSEALRV